MNLQRFQTQPLNFIAGDAIIDAVIYPAEGFIAQSLTVITDCELKIYKGNSNSGDLLLTVTQDNGLTIVGDTIVLNLLSSATTFNSYKGAGFYQLKITTEAGPYTIIQGLVSIS